MLPIRLAIEFGIAVPLVLFAFGSAVPLVLFAFGRHTAAWFTP